MSIYADRVGSKTGSGGVASQSQTNQMRRERLRQLIVDTADLTNDPYLMKNHLGKFECKLCLTLHPSDGSYLAHTQGKRHQENLGRRATRIQQSADVNLINEQKKKIQPRKTIKIGRPGYKVVKQKLGNQRSLLFQISYPRIEEGLAPRTRFMSAFEQKIEPPDEKFQYILFAAEPYETIAFKVPSTQIDKTEGKFMTHWDKDRQTFTLQLFFVPDQ